eukprot:6511952-Pyramimonas_sp.AAC.1
MEFSSTDDRNTVVNQLRNANIQHEGKSIWATVDRPPLVRAGRNFCFGVIYMLKDTMGIQYPVRVDGTTHPYTVTVGGELALSVTIDGQTVHREWSKEWLEWQELQSHAKLHELVAACDGIVDRSALSRKGGAKGLAKGT